MAELNTDQHESWLLDLVALPTAAGREQAVVEWVRRWAHERPTLTVEQDAHGNLMLRRPELDSPAPLLFEAHMDHPAFVVVEQEDETQLVCEFRGGVHARFFKPGAPLVLRSAERAAGVLGEPIDKPEGQWADRYRVELTEPAPVRLGDVIQWDTGPARIEQGQLYAPVCDNLAGVAACLAGFDHLLQGQGTQDVRVLLTRAEEVGFIGTIAACQSGFVPRGARVIVMENSKSFADSPIGGGPIVRVGDKTSTFDPDLTYRVGKVAERLGEADETFNWQRKLMAGGTCEASAFQSFGYAATSLCLPLGNYHNMNEVEEKMDAEHIALSDFHGLVRLLAEVGATLDDAAKTQPLRQRLEKLFTDRRKLLGE